LKLKGTPVVSVAFVGEREMSRLNKQYRGKDKVTDVLSFGAQKPDGSGEILICYEQAKRQAKELRHTTRDEVVFLLVHGLLHLSGLDHETPADAKQMFPLQEKLLTRLKVDPRL
jgi:probable rRNA maturation factor